MSCNIANGRGSFEQSGAPLAADEQFPPLRSKVRVVAAMCASPGCDTTRSPSRGADRCKRDEPVWGISLFACASTAAGSYTSLERGGSDSGTVNPRAAAAIG